MPNETTPLDKMYEAFNALSERDQRRFAAWAASQIGMELHEADPDAAAEREDG